MTPVHHVAVEVEQVDDNLWKVGVRYILFRGDHLRYPWLVLTPSGALPKATREEAFGFAVALELDP